MRMRNKFGGKFVYSTSKPLTIRSISEFKCLCPAPQCSKVISKRGLSAHVNGTACCGVFSAEQKESIRQVSAAAKALRERIVRRQKREMHKACLASAITPHGQPNKASSSDPQDMWNHFGHSEGTIATKQTRTMTTKQKACRHSTVKNHRTSTGQPDVTRSQVPVQVLEPPNAMLLTEPTAVARHGNVTCHSRPMDIAMPARTTRTDRTGSNSSIYAQPRHTERATFSRSSVQSECPMAIPQEHVTRSHDDLPSHADKFEDCGLVSRNRKAESAFSSKLEPVLVESRVKSSRQWSPSDDDPTSFAYQTRIAELVAEIVTQELGCRSGTMDGQTRAKPSELRAWARSIHVPLWTSMRPSR